MDVRKQDAGTFYAPPMQKILAEGGSLFPVGFYYKWFTKPASLSKFFLTQIRPLAGVGRIPKAPLRGLPALSEGHAATEPLEATDLGHCDTIIVGGGLSGLQAAGTAQGRTLIIDDHVKPGGQRLAAMQRVNEKFPNQVQRFQGHVSLLTNLNNAVGSLGSLENVSFMGDTKVIAGYFPDGLLLRQGSALKTVSFSKLIWAAGALDTLGLFPGNDTPGAIGPRALYRLVMRDGLSVDGKHIILVGGGYDFWLSAAMLSAKGAHVSLVVTESGAQSEVSAAMDLKWSLHTGLRLASMRTKGENAVEATFIPQENTPGPVNSHLSLTADLVVLCNRGKPVYDIPYQLGCDLTLQPDNGGYLPRDLDSTGYQGTLPDGADFEVFGEAAGTLPGDLTRINEEGAPS
jgi:thioredoxin reductase